jgi:large subunit ribosomal protein L25
VLYGHSLEVRHLTLPGHEVLLALRTANVLIRIEGLPGGAQLALPKAIQRDPIRGSVEHVDLLVVRRGEKVTVDVPVNVSGEVAPDGLLDQQLIQITVEAEATNIPRGIDIDVEGMAIGDAVHASDLALPAGTTLAVEPDILVLHVIPAPTAEQIEAEIGEAEPTEVPEAPAAPAAGGEGAAETSPGSSEPAEGSG